MYADFQITAVLEVIHVSEVRMHRLGQNMCVCTDGEFELHSNVSSLWYVKRFLI